MGHIRSSASKTSICGTTTGRDFVPSRKHSQAHFSTDSTARKGNHHCSMRDTAPMKSASSVWIVQYDESPDNTILGVFATAGSRG